MPHQEENHCNHTILNFNPLKESTKKFAKEFHSFSYIESFNLGII